jgi:4-diphosphocytidyl-2-C-methyl-D-erythritol kinase
MFVSIPSFAKINLGLKIGPPRPDGFHELRTIYQTLALHDVIGVDVQPGSGIEIRCDDPRVPLDSSNTCYKIANHVLTALVSSNTAPQGLKPGLIDDIYGAPKGAPLQGRIAIEIEKRLPVQGGLGAASSNAVATMLGLERALGVKLAAEEKLNIAAEVGSDVPLFLIGGTVLGVGRGEEVYPLPDLPALHVVVVTPPVGVSTPQAFARWDALNVQARELTRADAAGTISKFAHNVFGWLSESFYPQAVPASGVPAKGGDRAETPLLDLVRAGIQNDFERVVFPEYPELREVKELLLRERASYASLSGSGSTLYGLFASAENAQAAAGRMSAAGHAAIATTTLTRKEYWQAMEASSPELRAKT